MDRVKFLAVLLVHKILMVLPDGFLLEVSLFASPVVRHLIPKKNSQLEENNAVAFADVSESNLRSISKRSLVSYVQSAVFDLKYGLCDSEKVNVDFEFSQLEELSTKYRDSAVVCVVPHLGMTLLAAKLLARHSGRRVVVPVRANKKCAFERMFINKMSDNKIEFIASGNAMERIKNAIEDKAIVVLGFDVVDTVKHTKEVDFFGHRVSFPSGPVWLASEFDLPIISGAAAAHFRPFKVIFTTDEPVDAAKNSDKQLQSITSRVERHIKNNPGKWCMPDNYFAN